MAAREDFQYAVMRVVPRIERGECLNAGVVLFCRRRGFLGARVALDEAALAALAPGCEAAEVRSSGSRPAIRRAARSRRWSPPSGSTG